MIIRECPFCTHYDANFYSRRGTTVWARCQTCRSIFRDVSASDFEGLHKRAEDQSSLIPRSMTASGDRPREEVWRSIGLVGSTVLEIGPGAGHVLAAAKQAGRQVWGVETNSAHRAHIAAAWGISTVVAALSDLPSEQKFDAIIMINVLEHVHDVRGFLRDLSSRLAPGGGIFISTPNAACVVSQVARAWWSMCKEVDHVAFPTAAGMSAAAASAGLIVNRVWSSELPLETPIGFAVAARDYLRSTRLGKHPSVPEERTTQTIVSARQTLSRRTIHWIYRTGGKREPSARLVGRLGRAASIKAILVHQDPVSALERDRYVPDPALSP
ncbi:type 12 methyltransferase [Candidatus Protofrankia californiensis]|uniref:Type 12 methyltransferase n=1 Tax=Candidatus Protofrankia californiensis TaxID=1839754 RepID=A0A1C3NXR7_9ACTN|nr:type 12 methyltransferase [Candidatus Protofrankia californiensis]